MAEIITFFSDITWAGVSAILSILGIAATVMAGSIAIFKFWKSSPSKQVVQDVQDLYKELATIRGVVSECRAELDKFNGINDTETEHIKSQIEDAKRNIERLKSQIDRLTSVIIEHFGKSGQ